MGYQIGSKSSSFSKTIMTVSLFNIMTFKIQYAQKKVSKTVNSFTQLLCWWRNNFLSITKMEKLFFMNTEKNDNLCSSIFILHLQDGLTSQQSASNRIALPVFFYYSFILPWEYFYWKAAMNKKNKNNWSYIIRLFV